MINSRSLTEGSLINAIRNVMHMNKNIIKESLCRTPNMMGHVIVDGNDPYSPLPDSML
jgi:hypothetical protein